MRIFVTFCLGLLLSAPAMAQGALVPFGTQADTSLPVEVTSDNLDVNQEDGTAEFTGNVVIVQGEMTLSADRVQVNYDETARRISSMDADGNVVLINGPDAAEADAAKYAVDTGLVVLTGNVLMTQSANAVASERADINLVDGTARMGGRVRTILLPAGEGGEN